MHPESDGLETQIGRPKQGTVKFTHSDRIEEMYNCSSSSSSRKLAGFVLLTRFGMGTRRSDAPETILTKIDETVKGKKNWQD